MKSEVVDEVKRSRQQQTINLLMGSFDASELRLGLEEGGGGVSG